MLFVYRHLCGNQKPIFMRVFVTGASGFIGKAILKELLTAGHEVLGLARSDASAKILLAAGAEVHLGDLEDLDSLQSGASHADGVIHAGFIHDFTRFAEVCKIDYQAIKAMGSALAGTGRPLVVTSGTALIDPGHMVTEDTPLPEHPDWPRISEKAANELFLEGIHTTTIRLAPVVHGEGDRHGFIPILFNVARQKGMAAFVAQGHNRWNAVHRLDAARLFRLALEKSLPGACYHGVAEPALTLQSIAEKIGRQLHLPAQSIEKQDTEAHFGWFAQMAMADSPASSKFTQASLDWHPDCPTLFQDIENGIYTPSTKQETI